LTKKYALIISNGVRSLPREELGKYRELLERHTIQPKRSRNDNLREARGVTVYLGLEKYEMIFKVNDPTALLWGILNCKDKGTPSPYNPCHSSPQLAEGYSGIFFMKDKSTDIKELKMSQLKIEKLTQPLPHYS